MSCLNLIPHIITVYASNEPSLVVFAALATERLAMPYSVGTLIRWNTSASPDAPTSPRPRVAMVNVLNGLLESDGNKQAEAYGGDVDEEVLPSMNHRYY